MKCALCDHTVEDDEAAMEEDWTPYAYTQDGEEIGPVCPTHPLTLKEDGEVEVEVVRYH